MIADTLRKIHLPVDPESRPMVLKQVHESRRLIDVDDCKSGEIHSSVPLFQVQKAWIQPFDFKLT